MGTQTSRLSGALDPQHAVAFPVSAANRLGGIADLSLVSSGGCTTECWLLILPRAAHLSLRAVPRTSQERELARFALQLTQVPKSQGRSTESGCWSVRTLQSVDQQLK